MYNGPLPWVSNPVAQEILAYTQVAYPIILLLIYIIVFTVRSIVTARSDDNAQTTTSEQLGPGGKPLPKKNNNQKKKTIIPKALEFSRPRRLLFEWLSVGVLATLAANIAVVIVHTLWEREERWWCGQAPTVSQYMSSALRARLIQSRSISLDPSWSTHFS